MFSWIGNFNRKKSHFQHLHEKWLNRHQELQKKVWDKHGSSLSWFLKQQKYALMTGVAGLVVLTSSGVPTPQVHFDQTNQEPFKKLDAATTFIIDLQQYLPKEVRPLTSDEEKHITHILSQRLNMKVTAELQGIRLERNYGYIGKEQLLARFPGDTVEKHITSPDETALYEDSGMAPGLGAWGYISDPLKEKYYIAAQTFLAPGYTNHVKEYNEFFKFRKVIVVNPDNGKAIVTVIGDAGPSIWTGKTLGGSPFVMHYLERVDGAQKGGVLYFFIDDPTNSIPLGPVTSLDISDKI